jgi:hypothetical protein
MGEMLRETERARGQLKVGPQLPEVTTGAPTLASLGLTKRESSEAQVLAGISDKEFEKLKAGQITKKTIVICKKRLNNLEKRTNIRGGNYETHLCYFSCNLVCNHNLWIRHSSGNGRPTHDRTGEEKVTATNGQYSS